MSHLEAEFRLQMFSTAFPDVETGRTTALRRKPAATLTAIIGRTYRRMLAAARETRCESGGMLGVEKEIC